jgi:hypothetical protein
MPLPVDALVYAAAALLFRDEQTRGRVNAGAALQWDTPAEEEAADETVESS